MPGAAKLSNSHLTTVLVVDDDAEWRSCLSSILGSQYRVIAVGSSEEALLEARRMPPGVIILDVMMTGGKDGFATFCELKKTPQTKDIPVIMLSEVNQVNDLAFGPEEMRQYLGAAPFAFLEKPVNHDHLMKTIATAIAQKTAQGTQPSQSE